MIRLLVGLAFVASVALVTMAYHNGTAGILADDAIYLLMANWFSNLCGYAVPSDQFVWQQSQFPPVYPLIIGVLGGNAENIPYAHALTACMTVVGAAVAFFWSRVAFKLSSQTCCLVMLWWLLLPKTTLASVEAMSEPLYVALSFAALLFLEKSGRRPWILVIGVALVVVSVLTRSIGIALAVAALIFIARTHGRKVFLAALLAVGTPIVLWTFLSMRFFGGSRVYVGEPKNYFLSVPPDVILNGLFIRWPEQFWSAWVSQFVSSDNAILVILCGMVLVLSVSGMVRRIVDGSIDGKYVLLYLLIVWIWPYPDHIHRFIWPLMPIFLCYAADSLKALAVVTRIDLRVVQPTLASLVLVVAIANWIALLQRFMMNIPEELSQFRGSRFVLRTDQPVNAVGNLILFREITQAMSQAGAMVPEGECITSVNRDLMMLYGRRPSVFPPLPGGSPDDIRRRLECSYLFAQNEMESPYFPKNYPQDLIAGKEVLAQFTFDVGGSIQAPLGTLYRIPVSGKQ